MSDLAITKQEELNQMIDDGSPIEKECAKCKVKESEVFRPFKGTICRSCASAGFTGGFSQLEDNRISPNPLDR